MCHEVDVTMLCAFRNVNITGSGMIVDYDNGSWRLLYSVYYPDPEYLEPIIVCEHSYC